MTKITELKEKTYQGKVTGHTVTLDDGRTGNLSDKDSDKNLQIGEEVTATITDYVSKAGNHSNLITLKRAVVSQQPPVLAPMVTQKPGSTASQPSSIFQAKATATVKAMEFVVNAFIADKITWDKIKEYHKEITVYLTDAIDDCQA